MATAGVWSIVMGVFFAIAQKNEELAKLTAQVAEVENENKMLSRYSDEQYKVEYIETIARDKLGYAKPEERIYYIVPAD